jgi:hypothetical protein
MAAWGQKRSNPTERAWRGSELEASTYGGPTGTAGARQETGWAFWGHVVISPDECGPGWAGVLLCYG